MMTVAKYLGWDVSELEPVSTKHGTYPLSIIVIVCHMYPIGRLPNVLYSCRETKRLVKYPTLTALRAMWRNLSDVV